jgi:hypothetical protein
MAKPSSTSSRPNGHWPTSIPDPEVEARATRRRFSAAHKRRIVEEADRCTEPGAIGALLWRVVLRAPYPSWLHISSRPAFFLVSKRVLKCGQKKPTTGET